MKECAKCHRMLDESEFNINRKAKDGLQSYCKSCQKEDFRKRTGGGKFRKVFTNPELAPFTPRQLMDELKARGYSGTLKYVEMIEI